MKSLKSILHVYEIDEIAKHEKMRKLVQFISTFRRTHFLPKLRRTTWMCLLYDAHTEITESQTDS